MKSVLPSSPASLSEYAAEQTQHALHQSVFMSSLLAHPFRDLPLGREQHCKLLPGVADIQAGEVARWTVDEVSRAAVGPWERMRSTAENLS